MVNADLAQSHAGFVPFWPAVAHPVLDAPGRRFAAPRNDDRVISFLITPPASPGPSPGSAPSPFRGGMTVTHHSAACAVTAAGFPNGSPSSLGSEGSRDHSFHEPKYMRTSSTPASLSATMVLEARAPLKQ